jgi:drug/metabolite transporter (DMT)-like permease
MPGREGVASGANRMSAHPIPRRALILLVILTFVWGTNWPLFPLAVQEVSVWTFRSVSTAAAGAVLLAVARARGQSLSIPARHVPAVLIATLFYLVIWNVASTYAAVLLPSGQAAILGFTMPLWSALIGWAVLGEALTRRLVVAVMLGAAAVTMLMVPNFGDYAGAPAGLAFGLASGVGWAIGTLVLKRSGVDIPATVLTGWQLLLAAVPITGVAIAVGDHQWFMPSWQTIAVITYITLVPVTIGNLTWFSIVGLLPAQVAGLSSIMVPMVAMLSGAVVHGEPLGAVQWAAMTCSAAALWLALSRAKPSPAPPTVPPAVKL